MKKIKVRIMDGNIIIGFVDYADERQLKDFYKLFKKATGYVVQEYRPDKDRIVALTNNVNSMGIAWCKTEGCHLYSGKDDRSEVMQVAYRMLCYRYSLYATYEEAFNAEILDRPIAGAPESQNDPDILEDIANLKSIGKMA